MAKNLLWGNLDDWFESEHAAIKMITHSLKPEKVPGDILGAIIDHLSDHFKEEEHLMYKIRYPHLPDHYLDHYEIQVLFISYLSKMLSGNITKEELEVFQDRLILHIDTLDHQLDHFIESNKTKLQEEYGLFRPNQPSVDN